ncbi:hypothetical protein [Tepidanaerobacter sp. EBM-38]|nr:hypothetical protein [Tepidanaerobacter sp. EBM-38]
MMDKLYVKEDLRFISNSAKLSIVYEEENCGIYLYHIISQDM